MDDFVSTAPWHRSALSLRGLLASVAAEGLSELAQHAAGDISILCGFASPLADGLAEVRFS